MPKNWKVPLIIIVIMFAVLAASFILPGRQGNKVLAPAFTLPTLDGGQVSLASFKGQVVVLNFWATWCPYCVAEMEELDKAAGRLADQGVKVLAVNIMQRETEAGIRAFLGNKEHNYLVLLDHDSRVARSYGVAGIPTTFIIDRQGQIRRVKQGPLGPGELDNLVKDLL
ncbi:MAG: cytochrome c biosis protein CcmG, thiol:disulfide interchange protein DsbE [Moorella sp. (in: firmicutes)]|uniref:peroxiredoxin family protein n=1 Tax=unclassified Neomoorella TaxID=2676739 RepID=UPI0010FFAD88|nr:MULTISPECIES: TlpA disulfide reductase family protein [unclassified Moorella (in: firmicutes)]MDK2817714.1 cytochrome c biosis protein CcmG, thiol:disulfide interchange protein DsbE [Moorella sp. (in: firmicutes)]MDK2894742.1 cytochrome c biosis protein CcmG, thiol:disulfide interchange protein DsbE [Moorella sp. (in: firmicutes)]GEA16252.1 peroxiredoxin-like protein [Moorella sp. E308F]GEA18888.1 peroxiredoxin-like protein [Moorella sp. E306M]